MSCNCRKAPPIKVCLTCYSQNNNKCKLHCRDAFVYDKTINDEQKVKILKSKYKDGGKPNGMKMGVKIPKNLMVLLNKSG
jgi:hypothetical protein